MSVIALLLDAQPKWKAIPPEGCASLLTPRLGAQSYISYLCESVQDVDAMQVHVVPEEQLAPSEKAMLTESAPVSITPRSELDAFIETLETSDLLLFVNASRFPLDGYPFERLFENNDGGRATRHLVHMRRTALDAEERILINPDSSLRAMERIYGGVTQLRTVGVTASLVTVAALRSIQLGRDWTLGDIRIQLASAHIMSSDVPMTSTVFNLTKPRDWLAAVEHQLVRETNDEPPVGLKEIRPGVWAAANVQIAPSARVYGPAIIHRGGHIKEGATLVGPVLLGPEVTINRDAVVAHSFVAGKTSIPAETHHTNWVITSDHTVFAGDDGESFGEPTLLERDFAASEDSPGFEQRESFGEGIKRGLDIFASALGLLVCFIPLTIVALMVKLTSRGPIFFGHDREGRDGKPFRCWKFRTMVENAHLAQRQLYAENAVDGPQFKMDRDPRVTALGKVLRKTNIDELPQLWNVLRGEMSLIGPRPSPFRENQICVPWRKARLSVRPGITGLWQICRHDRDTGDFHQWIHFDTLYVRHQNLWLDTKILLATVATLGGRWSVPPSWIFSEPVDDNTTLVSSLPRRSKRERELSEPTNPASMSLETKLT